MQAKAEDLQLKKTIVELDKANMTAEERTAHDEASTAITTAKTKY